MESRHRGDGVKTVSYRLSLLAVRGEATAAGTAGTLGTEQRAQRGRGSVILSIVSIKGSHLPGWGQEQKALWEVLRVWRGLRHFGIFLEWSTLMPLLPAEIQNLVPGDRGRGCTSVAGAARLPTTLRVLPPSEATTRAAHPAPAPRPHARGGALPPPSSHTSWRAPARAYGTPTRQCARPNVGGGAKRDRRTRREGTWFAGSLRAAPGWLPPSSTSTPDVPSGTFRRKGWWLHGDSPCGSGSPPSCSGPLLPPLRWEGAGLRGGGRRLWRKDEQWAGEAPGHVRGSRQRPAGKRVDSGRWLRRQGAEGWVMGGWPPPPAPGRLAPASSPRVAAALPGAGTRISPVRNQS